MPSSAWRKITDREIERLMRNAAAGRKICARLLRARADAISDTGEAFLRGMLDKTWLETWTYDRARVVLEIRRESFFVETARDGASIELLIRKCWERRDELDEWSCEWIESLYTHSPRSIRRRHVARLERCAAKVDVLAA